MVIHTAVLEETAASYVFTCSKAHKDGFGFEAGARELKSGRFYYVRFIGRKKYEFYVYQNGEWQVRFMDCCGRFSSGSFCCAEDFLSLEAAVKSGEEKPALFLHGSSAQLERCRLKGGARVLLPQPSFYYPGELQRLDVITRRMLYNYSEPPEYLIFARKGRGGNAKPRGTLSVSVFGCGKKRLFDDIERGSQLVVTAAGRNEYAVALSKAENEYSVIPPQCCLRVERPGIIA